MKLYIPEIGDHLRLTQDWTFTLHGEGRNAKLASLFGYRQYGYSSWIEISKIEDEPEKNYTIVYPNEENFINVFGRIDWEAYNLAREKAVDENESYQAYLKAYAEWNERAKSLATNDITVTLPTGTVLAVDRIYIRKGSSDYSSITFWAKGLGESEVKNRWSKISRKWKLHRFWAKLQDCNKIEFEMLTPEEIETLKNK